MNYEDICNFIPSRSISKDLVPVHFVRERLFFSETPMVENIYSANLVVNGAGNLHSNFGVFPLNVGDLFFTFPDSAFRIENKGSLDYIYITYLGVRANSLAERLHLKKQNPVCSGQNALIPVWERAIETANNENVDMFAEGLLLYSLASICSDDNEKQPTTPTVSIELQIKRYMEEHFFEPEISLKTVADHFGYNDKYLSERFRKTLRIGFSDYLKDLRLNYAIAQIRDGEKNVTQLARSSGYEDPLYFSRVFTKKFGVSPKKYMISYANGKTAEPSGRP